MATNSSSPPHGPSPRPSQTVDGKIGAGMALQSDNTSTSFWETLQEEKNVTIPLYIKNIFKLSHLDNPIAFRSITDEALKEIEIFARENMRIFLDPDDNLELFYGQFHKVPEKFCFLLGDKFLLQNLVKFVQSTTDEFWKPKKNLEKSRVNVNTFKSNLTQSSTSSPTTLDINEEKKHLLKLVKSVVQNLLSDEKDVLDKIQITVTVSEIYEQDNLPKTFTYEAKIKCPLCSNESKLKKCGDVDSKGSRWVISNFRRHFVKHASRSRQDSVSNVATSTAAKKLRKFAYDKNETAATSNPIPNASVDENNMPAINNQTFDYACDTTSERASELLSSEERTEILASTGVPQSIPLKALSQNNINEYESISLSTNSKLIQTSLDVLQKDSQGEY